VHYDAVLGEADSEHQRDALYPETLRFPFAVPVSVAIFCRAFF